MHHCTANSHDVSNLRCQDRSTMYVSQNPHFLIASVDAIVGATLPANTLSIVEMNVGIVAASLVAMRPFFQDLHGVIFHCQNGHDSSCRGPTKYCNHLNHTNQQRDSKTIPTMQMTEIKPRSRSVSTEESVPSRPSSQERVE